MHVSRRTSLIRKLGPVRLTNLAVDRSERRSQAVYRVHSKPEGYGKSCATLSKSFRYSSSGMPFARRGLAPLELVLTLPMLVLMMALMIDFGFAGVWKIRTQTNARYAGWRTLTARTGQFNATPPYWSNQGASLSAQWGTALPNVNQQWDATQDLLCPCARGQRLTAPNSVAAINVPGRLEMDDDVVRGHADLDRPLPLFRGAMPASNGRFRFDINLDLLDKHWQYNTLGLTSNADSRARVWWDIEHADLAGLDGATARNKQPLDQNLQQLQTNPNQADLDPLDDDDEFQRDSGNAPEFYPRLESLCMADADALSLRAISRTDSNGRSNPNALLSRIDRLPCSMSGSFIGMYRVWIKKLEECGAADGDIDPLRQRYGDLQQFMATLGSVGCSRPDNLQGSRPPMLPIPSPSCPASPVGVGY